MSYKVIIFRLICVRRPLSRKGGMHQVKTGYALSLTMNSPSGKKVGRSL